MSRVGSILRITAAVLVSSALSPISAFATPGDPDPAFGTLGVVTGTATTSGDVAYGADGAGLNYVTGGAQRGTAIHLFLARYLANGTLDPTFGTAGRTMLRLDNNSDGRAVRVQSDGKVVVVGNHYVPNQYEILVTRFNADGSLDTAFATNGVYSHRVGAWSGGEAVAIQPDGKIVVAGYGQYVSVPTGNSDMVVIRLNADGTPDATFGTAGIKTIDFRGGADGANMVAITAGGKILVAGGGSTPAGFASNDFAIARLNADGTVDTTFGPPAQNGLVMVDVTGNYDYAQAMAVDTGVIWLAGVSQRTSDNQYVYSLAKLTDTGLLDTTFGGTGTALGNNPGGFPFSIALSPGKVLVGGTAGGHIVMMRYATTGALDASFGTSGVFIDPAPSAGFLAGMAYDGTGIIAVGVVTEAGDPFNQDVVRAHYTAAGTVDAAYGTGGRTTTNLFDLSWDIRAVTVTADGHIVAAGTLYDAFDSDFVALRLNPDGTRDTSFGFLGLTTVGFGKGDDRAYAMLPMPDGSLVLGGRSVVLGTSYFALTRLTANGALDTTFGTAGRTTHTIWLGYAEITALAATADGKIVAAGDALVTSGNYDFTLGRYSANGVLDTTLGGSGTIVTPFGTLQNIAQSLAVQPDGKIVIAGYMRVGNVFDFAIARYAANGVLDTTFGAGGKVTVVTAANDFAHSMAVLPNGKILVAGEAFNGATNNDMVVIRLLANGALDATFGTAGTAVVNFAGGADAAWAMAVQSNSKIVLAGTAFDGSTGAFALARLNSEGTLDTGFGFGYAGGGRETTDLSGSIDTAYAVRIQRDGKIVSAGVAGTRWGVTRHLGDPPFRLTDLDGSGKSDLLYRNVATGQVYRMLMDGFTIANAALAYTEPDTAWKIVADADFNGDGITDLLWRNDTTGQVFLQPFGANGLPSGGAVIYTEPNPAWKIVGTPDFDGDGKADLLWWNSFTGQVYCVRVDGFTLGVQGMVYTEPNTAWKIVATGDFAGSGKRNQVLWQNGTTGQVYFMVIGLSGSLYTQGGLMMYQQPNTAWKIAGTADFNGDGKTDILWRNDVTGQAYAMLMNGAVSSSEGFVYTEPNLAWKIVSQGDYDGDGRADILYRNDVTGQVYMLLMNGLTISAQQIVYTEANLAWKLLGPWEYSQP